jgi:hypothetical protein
MKSLIAAVCAVFVSSAALADGVPLLTAGPGIAASDPARQAAPAKARGFVKLHSVKLNPSAFGSNVLTVAIEGKEYRFGGAMMTQTDPKIVSWRGTAPVAGSSEPAVITLSRHVKSGQVAALISVPPDRNFQFSSTWPGAMFESKPGAGVAPTAPAPTPPMPPTPGAPK